MKSYVLLASVVLAVYNTLALGDMIYEGQWGKYGTGNGEFSFAAIIAVATNGNVYVCENANNRVQYFTSSGSYLGKWGSRGTGNGQFDQPLGLTIIPSNSRIYVADRYNHRVQYFTSTGSFLGKWGSMGKLNGQFYYPYDIAFGSLTNYIYVADTENDRIQYFTTTGSYLGQWSYGISGYPRGVTVSPKTGSVYVACTTSNIIRFTPTGSYLGQWNIYQADPHGMAFTPNGAVIFVTSFSLHRCYYFTALGSFLGSWGSKGTGNGQFDNPWGVGVSPDGRRVYVSEARGNRAQYFRDTTAAVAPASFGKVKAVFR